MILNCFLLISYLNFLSKLYENKTILANEMLFQMCENQMRML